MQEFKILWFEDNLNDFDDIIPKIESHCLAHSRLFLFDHFEKYPQNFGVRLFDGEHSIAFIDLNLQNGQKGIEIIKILRENGAFIDVLLYSNNPGELIKLTEGKNYVEGVFRHATLTGIEEKMKEVIDQVLYKEMMAVSRLTNYNKE